MICYAELSFLQDSSICFNLLFLLFFTQLLLCFGGIVTSLMELMLLFLLCLFLKGLLHHWSTCLGFFDDLVLRAKLCTLGVKDQVVERACKGGGKGTLLCREGSFRWRTGRSRQVNNVGVSICIVRGHFVMKLCLSFPICKLRIITCFNKVFCELCYWNSVLLLSC